MPGFGVDHLTQSLHPFRPGILEVWGKVWQWLVVCCYGDINVLGKRLHAVEGSIDNRDAEHFKQEPCIMTECACVCVCVCVCGDCMQLVLAL